MIKKVKKMNFNDDLLIKPKNKEQIIYVFFWRG